MKSTLKKLITKIPGGEGGLAALQEHRRQRILKGFKNKTEVFEHHYEKNFWGNAESVSGAGSTLEYTANIRKELPGLIESLGIKSILDAPCGDFNWFRHLERKEDVCYIGGDIVTSLVAKNNEQFGNGNTRFMVFDITADPLPEVDLWLCRDCLFHLPYADIHLVLERFKKSTIRYLLTTTYPETPVNKDILVGDFRLLNLQIAPFNLCPPKLVMDDWVEGHPVRHLALWERSMLV